MLFEKSQSKPLQTGVCLMSILCKWATSSKGHANGLWLVDFDPSCLFSSWKDGWRKKSGMHDTERILNFKFLPPIPITSFTSECLLFWNVTLIRFTITLSWRGVWNKALSDAWCNVKFSFCFTGKYKAIWNENLVVDKETCSTGYHAADRLWFKVPLKTVWLIRNLFWLA